MLRSRPLGRLVLLALTLTSLIVGGACDRQVTAESGCVLDLECAKGESCVAERCVRSGGDEDDDAGPLPDGGQGDAGEPDPDPPDAGPCEPDTLGNGTPGSAFEPGFNAEEGTPAVGRFCPGADEYFRFHGFEGDPVHVVTLWDRPADIDVELIPPGAQSGEVIGASGHPRVEVSTSQLSHTGDHVVRLFPSGALPPGGLDYRAEIRSGLPCRTEAACVGSPELRCVMPLWTPESPAGDAPDVETIFRGGMCARPYEPCDPLLADSPEAEGVSNSRTNAIAGLPTASAWSCQLDEDWFRYEMPLRGDLTLRFTNQSDVAATYLLSVYDVEGNMVQGIGWADLPSGEARALVLPYLRDGTVLYVRVLQLHDDDHGLYRLRAETTATECAGAADCARPEARGFGRSECRTGACECPLPEACAPPP